MIDPKEPKYSKSHEWVRYDGDDVVIGISDYAQESLGDLVFVNLPEVDDELTVGEALGDVESVKAVSDIISPVSGKVTEINEALLDSPEMINEDPYDAWFVKVTDVQETEDLLSADEYDEFVKEEEA
ncbi:glycine cleavage system protein GcvH [Mobilibacterium timonense]|uniref:glycine cleavage system protein GcvH n=1 Tax=Mobilibacterium timonense TaxID=1871012 RepID=UPI0009869F13|nr:glycine cleavage system protein GcvH [Mobilibacterium timonense]